MSKKPIDWERNNTDAGQVMSQTISPPVKSRKNLE